MSIQQAEGYKPSCRYDRQYSKEDWFALMSQLPPARQDMVRRFLREWCEPLGIWEAPASTYHHNCCPGGLIDHMTRVTQIAVAVHNGVFPELRRESLILCGLLHDLGKLGWLTSQGPIPRYVVNNEFDDTEPISKSNQPYNYNHKQIDLSMTISGAAIAARWLDLSIDEWKAITFHDGLYVPENVEMFKQHQAEPLLVTLHYADMMAGLVESGNTLLPHANLLIQGPNKEPIPCPTQPPPPPLQSPAKPLSC